ncbi:jg20306 [Pararge aegeria aegeria]|uniref:Jg20306 protein n=1 Tax=Pararge aegeria aegeria TaxID=348720 RepID=A0A8S4RLK0_9NEOP|nr:jg20306 [Pararge aegeria aegeria]
MALIDARGTRCIVSDVYQPPKLIVGAPALTRRGSEQLEEYGVIIFNPRPTKRAYVSSQNVKRLGSIHHADQVRIGILTEHPTKNSQAYWIGADT